MTNSLIITLVTCFYDVQEVQEGRDKTDINVDNWKFVHLTLRLNQPLIIFTSPDLVEKINSLRDSLSVGLREKTYIISKEFSDLEYYRYRDTIRKCRAINPIKNINLEKNSSDYCILTWSKFSFLNEAAKLNPFNSSHFGWIDVNIKQICKEVDPFIFNNTPDKTRVMLIKHPNPDDVSPDKLKLFFSYIQQNVSLGYFTGLRDNIINLYNEVDRYIQEFTNRDIAPIDEQLISFLIGIKPGLFTFFYGDNSSLLLNYHQPRSDLKKILLNLSTCKSLGLYEQGVICGSAVWKSLKSGSLRYNEDQLHNFLIEYFILVKSIELDSTNHTHAKEIAAFYNDRVNNNDTFYNLFANNHQFVNKLFSVINHKIPLKDEPRLDEHYLPGIYKISSNDKKTGLIVKDSIFDFKVDDTLNLILEKVHNKGNDEYILLNSNDPDLHLHMTLDTANNVLEHIVDNSTSKLNRYIACIWLGLKLKDTNLMKSIGYLTLAISIRRERPEAYAILGTIHREKGNNLLSTQLSIIPELDLLSYPQFNREPICNKQYIDTILYNISICSYYTSNKQLGRDACDKLFIYSDQYREQISHVLQFYLEPLSVISKIQLKPETPIEPTSGKHYEPLNPSITVYDGKYIILCRTINYTSINWVYTCYSPDGIARTENQILEMNSNFDLIKNTFIVDKSSRITYNTNWRGIDDGRLFIWDNQIYFTASFADSYADHTIRMGLIKLNSEYQIDRFIGFEPETYTKNEKNWIPIVNSDNKIELMYMYDQRHIVIPEFNPRESPAERIMCRRKDNFMMKQNLSWIRGGTVHIPYKDGYLCIIHHSFRILGLPKYCHRFLYLDLEYTPIKISDAWTLGHSNVEYITGLCWSLDKKNLVITYGVDDNFAYIAVIDPNIIRLKDI